MQKRFRDDEDFQLTTAETALLAKQATELQDYDQLPTAASKQAPPLVPVKSSAGAPALKHSTSMPASTAATKASAPAETAVPEAVMEPAHPVLLHSASMPAATTKAASAAADEAKAAADEAEAAADEARAAAKLPAGLNHIPSSPLCRSTQALHSVANAAVAAAAVAAPAAAPAATTAAADGAATAAAAAPAVSEGASQKSQSKIWWPPSAVNSSPQRSSGTSAPQAASSMPAGTPTKEASHTQARSQAAASVTAEQRPLTEGPASPLGALADKVGQNQRMHAKKRKCPDDGELLDSQESDMQATRGSKPAGFKSVLDSLGRGSQGKKAMGVDEGAQKEKKANGHAGKSLQAIAARQMAEALSKKIQNRSAGMGLA